MQTNNELAFFIAVAGEMEEWPGCVICRSLDDGANYTPLQEIAMPATIGVRTSILPSGTVTVIDQTNHVAVSLLNGTLVSCNELALYNGANSLLIGDEIIQFQKAKAQAAQQYQLSIFLRARQNTQSAMQHHAVGERCIILDERVVSIAIAPSLIGVEVFYKAVTLGAHVSDVAPKKFTYQAKMMGY